LDFVLTEPTPTQPYTLSRTPTQMALAAPKSKGVVERPVYVMTPVCNVLLD